MNDTRKPGAWLDAMSGELDEIANEVERQKVGRPCIAQKPLFPTSVQISHGLHRDLARLVDNTKRPFQSRSEAVRAAIAAMLVAYGYSRKEDW